MTSIPLSDSLQTANGLQACVVHRLPDPASQCALLGYVATDDGQQVTTWTEAGISADDPDFDLIHKRITWYNLLADGTFGDPCDHPPATADTCGKKRRVGLVRLIYVPGQHLLLKSFLTYKDAVAANRQNGRLAADGTSHG